METTKLSTEPVLRWIEVVAVTRRWLTDHPEMPKAWSQLLKLCSEDETGAVEFRRVLVDDDGASTSGQATKPIGPVAWFRHGPADAALLYEQGWTE